MRRPGIALILILILGAALRLGATFGIATETFLEIDGSDYREISENLARGRGFSVSHYRWFEPVPPDATETHPDLYRPPLLPILGAILFYFPGDWFFWARLASAAMGCLLLLTIYLLGKQLLGRTAGLIAAAMFALYPYAIRYSSRWSTEDPYALCVAAGILFLAVGFRRREPGYALAAGLTLGLATLARPLGLAMLGVLTLFSLSRGPERLRIRTVLFLLLGAIFVLTPWTVRNYKVTGSFNPVTYFGDYNVWLGMNDRMYEMYEAGHSPEFAEALDRLYRVDLKEQVRRLEEEGIHDVHSINSHWRAEVRAFIRENPGKALSILGHRFLHFFRPWPNRAVTSPGLFWLSTACLIPLFLLAIVGLILSRETRSAFLLIPCLVTLAASLPFVFHLRFRYPTVEPYLVLMAASGLAALAGHLKRRRMG